MVRAMIDLLIVAIEFSAQPAALVGYIVLGVYARTFFHALGYAVVWALAMQLFVTVTGSAGLVDPVSLGIQFGLRAAGSAVLTLGIYLLYRAMRGSSGGKSGGKGDRSTPPKRPTHLRRVK